VHSCDVQNDQVFCFSDTAFRKKRRGAWKIKSPRMEAMRLNSRVNAFWYPFRMANPEWHSGGTA